jgi:hypothetical protein
LLLSELLTFVVDFCVAQVHAIFALQKIAKRRLFPGPSDQSQDLPQHFAYIEWLSPFTARPDLNHKMYKVQSLDWQDLRFVSVIDVQSIYRSVHLIPRFGRSVPREWTTFNVLDKCQSFYVNCFTDWHTYLILYYPISTTTSLLETSLDVV